MKKQAIFVLGLIFGISSFAFAQTKTVTNADLAKYRQKRLQAERDLRENYRELGFPSPEELARQNEESQRERSELAQKLREERLAREEINREQVVYQVYENQDEYDPAYNYPNPGFIDYSRFGSSSYIYPGFSGRGYFRGNYRRNNNYRRTNFYRRNNNTNRPAFRSDRRLNRLQRTQTRRGNRNVFPGVGVVRSINGN